MTGGTLPHCRLQVCLIDSVQIAHSGHSTNHLAICHCTKFRDDIKRHWPQTSVSHRTKVFLLACHSLALLECRCQQSHPLVPNLIHVHVELGHAVSLAVKQAGQRGSSGRAQAVVANVQQLQRSGTTLRSRRRNMAVSAIFQGEAVADVCTVHARTAAKRAFGISSDCPRNITNASTCALMQP